MSTRAGRRTRVLRTARPAARFSKSLYRRKRCRIFGDLQLDVLVGVALNVVIDKKSFSRPVPNAHRAHQLSSAFGVKYHINP
ncbi:MULTISPECIES: hypothetical protein [unclassified Paraburkholderia]|uniref:hypothetical protein n=1 Tax=unclassified Paraburkholderia TaxID=2615204 RepID=UPI002AB283CA|nr:MULTISPECIES: hypothetical protein [unclassified Paraburkholderia]